jgi:aryl-alcohol dehydrogenase-like predicted oxidoreductase
VAERHFIGEKTHAGHPAHAGAGRNDRRQGLGDADRLAGVTGDPAIPTSDDRIQLAGGGVAIPPMGVGTWAWGDRRTWGMGGYDASFGEATIREAWQASIDGGVVFFDTAEVYGGGESERIIGRLLAEDPDRAAKVVIATKFMPSPHKLAVRPALMSSLRASLERLGRPSVDLLQIHGPISLRGHGAMADALAAAHGEGLARAVGVSNYSIREMRAIDRALRERGVPLATNQIELSLLRRHPESSGLLAACRELDVVPLAYSPIGQGRLTGKYSAAHPPPGSRTFSAHPMEQVDAIVAVLRRIGAAHPTDDGHDRTPSQVALAWIIAKGAVPIPGAKNRDQAEQNAGALGWALTAADLAALDEVALEGRRSLKNRLWQHG